MYLKPEILLENFNVLIQSIEKTIENTDKKEALINLHNKWADRIAVAPASSKKSYHNAFAGGYVLHVLNVIRAVGIVASSWKKMGMELDFTNEEMYFSAICHDLGKLGNDEYEYYLPCEESWMLKKGQVYVTNGNLQYMKVPERSLLLLNNAGITLTEKEYLAIKLHDGLYEDGNKAYYISYSEDYELKTCLPYILHQADMISAKVEGQKNKKNIL